MSKYITYGTINTNSEQLEKAKIKELKYFINDDKIIDMKIAEKFPLSDFGDNENNIEVMGSKNLIDLFERIDEKKIDITESLQNIKYKEISEENEIVLEFDDIIGTGIYNFTYEFFEELFDLGKYSRFCMNNDLIDLLEENIDKLLVKFKDKRNQYRFIQKNNEYLLRAITSSRYNNYDNNIAIYLVLLLLSRVSKKEKIDISLKSAYISDSDMKIFFEQDNYVSIDNIGDIYFGILVTNGEIRNSEFSAEVYYRVVDGQDKNLSFTAIPDIKDSIFNLKHNVGVETFVSKVQNISNLLEIENTMLSYIKSLKNIKSVSDNIIYSLMLKITQSRMLISETKENFKDICDKNLINNSMTLLQLFNKTKQITTDIDETIYLQRIYNEVIQEVLGRN